jgi:hypothetical protein
VPSRTRLEALVGRSAVRGLEEIVEELVVLEAATGLPRAATGR